MKYSIIFLFSIFLLNLHAQVNREPLFISFDSTLIHYNVQGEGKPVILIHGFISNSNSWNNSALIPSLIKNGYKVITIDLRGNGLSDKPHHLHKYENDAEVKDIIGLMKKLNFNKYDVIGYSRGAILTARLLVMGKNINKAVIGGMGADFTNVDWKRRKMFEEAFSGKAHLYPETKGAINYAKSINADTIVLGYLQHVQPTTTKDQLSKIQNKVLVISGDQDTDNGKAEELAKLIPHSILKTVPGNHNNTANTIGFANEVVEFLNGKLQKK